MDFLVLLPCDGSSLSADFTLTVILLEVLLDIVEGPRSLRCDDSLELQIGSILGLLVQELDQVEVCI